MSTTPEKAEETKVDPAKEEKVAKATEEKEPKSEKEDKKEETSSKDDKSSELEKAKKTSEEESIKSEKDSDPKPSQADKEKKKEEEVKETKEVKEVSDKKSEEKEKESKEEITATDGGEEEKQGRAKKEKEGKDQKEAEMTEEEILKFEEPQEEFDWDSVDKSGFGEDYNEKEKSQMEEEYAETLTTIEEKEVLKGKVVGINDRDVILNIGFKSDGLVSASEFRDIPDLKVGDEVEVYVEEQENANGQLVLSRRIAKIVKAWERIQDAYENDKVIDGVVKRRTKGGLIVDIFGVEAFLPGSQIDVKPIRDFDVFVGKKMEVKVVKINYSNDNVVVSHKVLIEKDLEAQKAEILNNLEKGQVLEGVIKNMTNFGVFIDLGGVDGLLHITDISWGRINHPEEVLNLDESLKVVVLDFDEDKKRISLGMKQLTPHPWDSLPKDLEIGSKVKGKIVNVADYGAFLEINPGVEGLIHVSEMSWSQHLRNPSDFLQVGDELEAVVLTLDREERKMSLGIKQLTEDPWTKENVLTKYAIGTIHKGIVRNLTNFGLFIELEEGIDGLVHVSDLSWTKKIKHPSEFVKVGEELEVKVLELDVENRRLALGHKQLEENPWDTFEDVFSIGSVHKCNIINMTDKGAILELPYGIEGFAARKNLVKEDGSMAVEGESLDFQVNEFSKEDKRISLSHSGTYRDEQPKPKSTGKKKKKPSAVDKINKDTDKDTLGDLEALSALKNKMEGETSKPKAETKTAKKESSDDKDAKGEGPKGKVEDTGVSKGAEVVKDTSDTKESKEVKDAKEPEKEEKAADESDKEDKTAKEKDSKSTSSVKSESESDSEKVKDAPQPKAEVKADKKKEEEASAKGKKEKEDK